MYAKKKVDERLAIASREFHLEPEYHSTAEVDQFDAYLRERGKYLYDNMGRPSATTNLSDFDRAWMLNEQILCASDASYWLTRYCNLVDEEGAVMRFKFRMAQRILFDIIAELEERDAAIEIITLKARQLGICLVPSTRVLTADLEWKRIENVSLGEELVAVDEYPMTGKGKERCMRTAVVRAKSERVHQTVEITLDTGVSITATPEHPFLCIVRPRRNGIGIDWKKSGDIQVGDRIKKITNVWDSITLDDAWLGGLIDGEGSLRQKERAGSELTIAQVAGPVLERARKILFDRYGPVREDVDRRVAGTSSKLGSQVVYKLVLGRMSSIFNILGRTRPTRFIGRHFWEGKGLPGKKVGDCWATVVSVRPAGEQRVINLDTSTGTFIAEGVVSHNTSLIQPLIGHRVFFGYGVNAIAGSADQQKTGIMASKMLLAYDHMPVWLRPQYTRRVESERGMLVFGGTLSGVSFQHGSQMSGIARGTTPTIYHLSEVASFVNAAALIDSSLFKCVHASPGVFGVLESTGEGDKGWWPDTWRRSKSTWPLSRLCPLFLPWFCGIGLYPTATWLGMRPVPDGWVPNADTRKHIAKAQLYVASTPLLSKHLGTGWRLPREQQWWWEITHEEAKSKGGEGEFLQELAGDDEEALQRSAESVFGHDAIALIDSGRERAYTVWGISGQSIEDAHEPPTELIDYSRDRIPIVYASMKGERYRWELIPLAFSPPPRENDPSDISGTLLVWHPPRPGVNYSIGVDTSEGKGQDSTVISVWALGYNKQPDIQVAEFASPYVSHVEAFSFVLCIAAYYRIHMEQGVTKWREPYVSVEQVAAVGDTCQLQMAKMGYTNFHLMSRYDDKRPNKKRARKRGWYTYGYTRPLLTGNFVHSTRNGWAVVNSPWLIEEMKTFEVHVTSTGREKLEHEEGEHDDRIFAAAMAIFCPHDMDMLADRSKKRIAEASALPPIDMSPYQGQMVSTASLRETAVRNADDLLYQDARLERFARE